MLVSSWNGPAHSSVLTISVILDHFISAKAHLSAGPHESGERIALKDAGSALV